MRRLLVGSALIVAGCVPLGNFACSDDEQCDPDGRCEEVGYCGYPDDGCASGRRFSRYAPDELAERCVEDAAGAWWDRAWTRRRPLTFANAGQEGSLNGFPVLVILDSTRIDYAVAAADGADLRFVDDDGETVLPAEIDTWNPEGRSFVWVGVPRIDAGSDDDFVHMYYGNDNPSEAPEGSPWAEGFAGVWHMGDSLADASGNGNDGVASGTSRAEGVIGGARQFSDETDAVDAGASQSLTDVFDGGGSASAWVFAVSYGRPWYSRIIDKARDVSSNEGYALLLADDGESVATVRFARGFDAEHAGWSATPGSFSLGAWHHVAVTYDATVGSNAPVLYIDGEALALDMTNPGAGAPESDREQRLVLGNSSSEPSGLEGMLDEVRVARTLRTSDWIVAEYLCGTDAFVTFGAEESL